MTDASSEGWTEHSRPQRRPDVEDVAVDGELLLWDPVTHDLHRLDPIGSVLWPFLDGDATVRDLATDAADVWGISLEVAIEGVTTLCEQLDDGRLLTSSELPVPADAEVGYLIDPPSP